MQERLERCEALLGRLTAAKCRRVFFTTKRLSTSIHQSVHRIIECGQQAVKGTLLLSVFCSSVQSSRSMSWFQPASASAAKGLCTLWLSKSRSMRSITSPLCCHSYSTTATLFLATTLSFSKTTRQHTQLVRRKSFCRPTLQTSLARTNGLPIHLT